VSDVAAHRYAQRKRRWALLALGLDLAYLWALPATGLAQAWGQRLVGWSPWPWQVAVYVAGLALPWTLLRLPLDWVRGFWLEHGFGLSREGVGRWSWRWLKVQGVGGALLVGMAIALVGILRVHPGSWWFWGSIVWVIWSVLVTQWAPVVLLPLFYRQRPIADPGLAARLLRLARDCGARVRGVYEVDLSRETAKANACLCGLGSTRRILVTDTMTRAYTPEELETIVAHELGHHQLQHLPRLLTVSAVTTLASFWVAGRTLPWWLGAFGIPSAQALAALPVVAFVLSVIGVGLTPLYHGVSRRFEQAADRFALERTRAPQAFIAAMQRLQRQNLAEAAPSRWVEWLWYDHPPIAKRVAMAEQYQAQRA